MFMRTIVSLRGLLMLAAFAVVSPVSSTAQAVIDGFQVGVGLSMYGGDLDGNSGSDLPSYVGSSRVHAFVGVDKDVGPTRIGLEFSFGQLRAINEQVDGTHTVLSADVTVAYMELGPIGFYAGVGPSMVLPSYERTSPSAVLDGWAVDGPHFAMTFPVGVVVQEKVRVGLRFSMSDLLDGFEGGKSRDVMGSLSVGIRIRTH